MPTNVRDLLRRMVQELPSTLAKPLVGQIARASIGDWSPTMLDLVVPDDSPEVAIADGPISEIAPAVLSPDGQSSGEILLWVKGGRLSFIEQPWWTDQPPTDWPSIENVRFGIPRFGRD